MKDSDKLLLYIDTVSFAINDVVLYLDTHPNDMVALEYYEHYKQARQQAIKDYTTYFGPLTSDMVNIKNGWAWVETPWPWEVEG